MYTNIILNNMNYNMYNLRGYQVNPCIDQKWFEARTI